MDKKFNIRTLNKIFGQSNIQIIQGNGYCYFTYTDNANEDFKNKMSSLYNSSVPVNKISSISYDHWIEIFNTLLDELSFDIDTYRESRYNGNNNQPIKNFMFIR